MTTATINLIQAIETFAAISFPEDILGQQQHFGRIEAEREQIVSAIREHFSQAGIEAAASLFAQAATNDMDYAVGGRFDDAE